jgi:hypothetical protein
MPHWNWWNPLPQPRIRRTCPRQPNPTPTPVGLTPSPQLRPRPVPQIAISLSPARSIHVNSHKNAPLTWRGNNALHPWSASPASLATPAPTALSRTPLPVPHSRNPQPISLRHCPNFNNPRHLPKHKNNSQTPPLRHCGISGQVLPPEIPRQLCFSVPSIPELARCGCSQRFWFSLCLCASVVNSVPSR